jgi:hypothetical protein
VKAAPEFTDALLVRRGKYSPHSATYRRLVRDLVANLGTAYDITDDMPKGQQLNTFRTGLRRAGQRSGVEIRWRVIDGRIYAVAIPLGATP